MVTYGLLYSLPFLAASLLGVSGMAFLGDRNRQFATNRHFLARLSTTMHVELGLAESLRLCSKKSPSNFTSEGDLLAYRDADLERIFLWRLKAGESERLIPDNLPITRADGFLLDDMEASVCWNVARAPVPVSAGIAATVRSLRCCPEIPGPTPQEFGIRALLIGGLRSGRSCRWTPLPGES